MDSVLFEITTEGAVYLAVIVLAGLGLLVGYVRGLKRDIRELKQGIRDLATLDPALTEVFPPDFYRWVAVDLDQVHSAASFILDRFRDTKTQATLDKLNALRAEEYREGSRR